MKTYSTIIKIAILFSISLFWSCKKEDKITINDFVGTYTCTDSQLFSLPTNVQSESKERDYQIVITRLEKKINTAIIHNLGDYGIHSPVEAIFEGEMLNFDNEKLQLGNITITVNQGNCKLSKDKEKTIEINYILNYPDGATTSGQIEAEKD